MKLKWNAKITVDAKITVEARTKEAKAKDNRTRTRKLPSRTLWIKIVFLAEWPLCSSSSVLDDFNQVFRHHF